MVPSALRLAVLFSFASVLCAQTSIFSGPRDYVVESNPASVVTADFNGDGLLDIAAANQASNSISVLLQNTDGSFQPAVNYPVGNGPTSLQVGDVNGDGKLDLLVLNATDGTLGVLLGNADGTFQAQTLTTITTVAFPAGVDMAVGNFRGAGNPLDVAIGVPLPTVGTYAMAVLLGNGNGTFQPAVNYSIDGPPTGVAAADFNNDGKLDLLSIDQSNVSVLLGNGDGTFQAAIITAVRGVSGSGMVLADFNGDGNRDIATLSAVGPTSGTFLTMLLGNGDGTFQVVTATVPNSGLLNVSGSTPLAAGDLNGDGKPDLVVCCTQVLLNSGDGKTFTLGQVLSLPSVSPNAALADLNGGNKLDLVFPQATSTTLPDVVSVLSGNGDGTFKTFPIYGAPEEFSGGFGSLAAADFNGDGKIDLDAALGNTMSGISAEGLFLNDGTGFSTVSTTDLTLASEGPPYVAAADFNGDSRMDLAVASNPRGGPTAVGILLGNGDGTFQAEADYGAGMTGPIAIGDFNNDGKPDVIGVILGETGINPTQISVLLNNGNGTFGFPVKTSIAGASPPSVESLAVADFNRDGNLDLAVVETTTLPVSRGVDIFLGNGHGGFSPGATFSIASASVVATGDLNGDGIPDLVVGTLDTCSSSSCSQLQLSNVMVFLGVGDGTFQTPKTTVAGNVIAAIAVADFNLDGKADVAITSNGGSVNGWNDVSVLLGNGDGTFKTPMQFSLNNSLQLQIGLAAADFNGDGEPDLAVAGGAGISLLLSGGGLGGAAVFLAPAAVTFGSEQVGNKSTQTAVLTNSGSDTLNISSIAVSGPQATDYKETNTCGATLFPGVSCTISITFSPTAAGTRTAIVQITDSAAGSPHTINLSGTGQDFSITVASASQTVSPGQTATYNLTVAPSDGFNQMVQMNCSGTPTGSTCSVSPASFTLNGSASQAVKVTVATVSNSASVRLPRFGPSSGNTSAALLWSLAIAGMISSLTFVTSRWGQRRCWRYGVAAVGMLCLGMTITACGGGGGGVSPGTYNLMVTGKFTGSTTVTHNTQLTLIVQ